MKLLRRFPVVCIWLVTLAVLAACTPASIAPSTSTVTPQPTPTTIAAPSITPQPSLPPNTSSSSSNLGPLFDGHLHYSADVWADYPVNKILSLLDQVGIQRALVSSTPNEGTVRLYQAAPARIIPELRPYRTNDDIGNWFANPQVYGMMTEELQRGIYRGIGEFHLYGDNAKSPGVKRIVDLAVANHLPLHAHSDSAAIENLFAANPQAKILWAHTGMTTPTDEVARMLARYPNLWAELSYRSDIVQDGKLVSEWRALFLKYPDRFVYGSDTWVASRWDSLPALVRTARGWLTELPNDVAAKIARQNFETLYGK